MRTINTTKEYYEHTETEKTEFLREQTECPVCHGKLDIFVECINAHYIKEEARCNQCMALSRVQDHCLH